MTHMSPSSRYDTSSHSVMDTAYRSSRTPGGHAHRSVLRHDQHASATVPGVRDARGAGSQTHRHDVPRCPTPPADRCSPADGTPCRGFPAARAAPLPAARPALQGLPQREAGFEPADSVRTPRGATEQPSGRPARDRENAEDSTRSAGTALFRVYTAAGSSCSAS